MRRSRQRAGGLFITFEGGEGVGKSTQIGILAKRLRDAGHPVTVSREPGGTPGAEAIRHVLLDQAAAESFGPAMEAILFAAARSDHVAQVIGPALDAGGIVIVDRFIDSTRVYQGTTGDLDQPFIGALERIAIGATRPDMTIILDLDPEIGLARAAERRDESADEDRFERETLSIHRARRAAFQAIAVAEPERCRLIDANGTTEDVAGRIWAAVEPELARTGQPVSSKAAGAA